MRIQQLGPATFVAVAVALLSVRPAPADEEVSLAAGEVLLNGQPLATGKIFFYLDDDEFVGARVKDGHYKVSRLPTGEWRVVIEGPGVPAQFASEEYSSLRVAVVTGTNTLNFSLVQGRRARDDAP